MAFTKATTTSSKLRAAAFGPAGAGKTFTALAMGEGMGGRMAVIDSERGSASKYADRFEFDTQILETKTVDEYITYINEAAAAGYDVLIIDSLTHAWETLNADIQKLADAKFQGNFWAAWSKGTPLQKKFIETILSYPGHIIATMRSKTEWQINGEGRKPVRVGLAPEQGKGIEYEFDILFELTPEHLATIIKDRTGKFQDKIIEKPGKAFGQELVDWLNEGAAPPPPTKTKEQMVSEYLAVKAELITILKTKADNGSDIFTEAERQAVAKAIADLKDHPIQEFLDTTNLLLAEKKSQLKDRLALPEAETTAPAASAPPAQASAPKAPAGTKATKETTKPGSLGDEFKKHMAERGKAQATATTATATAPATPSMYTEPEDDGFVDDIPDGFEQAKEKAPAKEELDIF
jgi:hypothetical protein